MSVSVRPAAAADADFIFALIGELAAYERLADAVTAPPAQVASALFGPAPRVFCEIAEWRGEPAGFALWFYSFSTFRGAGGLWLEDLFVRPRFRGKGLGKALLTRLARRCEEEGLARFEWTVLDWNTPSIAFYEAQGARLMSDWTICRVEGEALARLAGAGPRP